MSRNKHPEETVQKILDVSTRLFMDKGYENTSIQDILNELEGLTKGAIYHHFKSKEEILLAVMDCIAAESNQALAALRDDGNLSGREKLLAILKDAASCVLQGKNTAFKVAPNFRNNPKLLSAVLLGTIENLAPNYILLIIEQCIAEGSVQTEHAKQLAELIILSTNVWMNALIFENSPEDICCKLMLLLQILQSFGLNISDEEMQQLLQTGDASLPQK